ncbi:MAG: peptide deformylase [Candidatus Omnitrophica bacterium]|nr:peptide deformylase [Candidatus Omnitrophota bacterium]
MLKILTNKNPILRKSSDYLEKITAKDKQVFKQMLDLMYEKKGIGLAAVQVGILKRLITVDIGEGPMVLINPTIIKRKGKKVPMDEGCLSLPNITVKVYRYSQIVLKTMNISGKNVEFEATDLLARVLQHEIDHLNGKLIIDYLPWHKRIALKKAYSPSISLRIND